MRALFFAFVFMFSLSGWAAPSPAEIGQPPANEKKEKAKDEMPKAEVAPPLPVSQVRNEVAGHRAEQTTAKEDKHPDEVLAWRATAATAGIALLALFVAVLQVWFFKDQLGKMERSLTDSKAMADAANTSAKTALLQLNNSMEAERGYVKISHTPPGLDFTDDVSASVVFEVRNWGRTVATVSDVQVDLIKLGWGDPMPIPYPFPRRERESFPNGILVPQEYFFTKRHVNKASALKLDKQLWAIGHVDYSDIYGRRWRGGYARKFVYQKENNLLLNTESRDDFDRERIPGEGNDWDELATDRYYERHPNQKRTA